MRNFGLHPSVNFDVVLVTRIQDRILNLLDI